ncbi:hypothetical protein MRX96_038841 [Rhipicephalus microplus]
MTASGVGTSVKTNVVSSLPLLLGCWCLSISTSYTRAACERIAVNSAHALNSVASSTHIFPLKFTKHPARKFFGTPTFLHICQCLSYHVRNEKTMLPSKRGAYREALTVAQLLGLRLLVAASGDHKRGFGVM